MQFTCSCCLKVSPILTPPRVRLRSKSAHIPLLQISTVKEPLEGGVLTLPQLPVSSVKTSRSEGHSLTWHSCATLSPQVARLHPGRMASSPVLTPRLPSRCHWFTKARNKLHQSDPISSAVSLHWCLKHLLLSKSDQQKQMAVPISSHESLGSLSWAGFCAETWGIDYEREKGRERDVVLTVAESRRWSLHICLLFNDFNFL